MRIAVVLSVLTGLVIGVALFITMPSSVHGADCDNAIGACLRGRQLKAITFVEVLAVAAGLISIATALRIGWSRTIRPWQIAALSVVAAVLVFNVAVDPVSHLDNRFHGWLSGA